MHTKEINYEQYVGEYLAIDPDTREIIAHGKDLLKVAEASKRKGVDHPIFHPVQEPGVHRVQVVR